jgi:hypothetical protein
MSSLLETKVTAIGIVGSRTFRDEAFLKREVDELLSVYVNADTVVSGGAEGADRLGENYAKILGLKTKIFKPDWKKHGKKAGILRNKDIVDNSHVLLAFWDGKSPGTKNSIERAKRQGKSVFIRYNNKNTPPTGAVKKPNNKSRLLRYFLNFLFAGSPFVVVSEDRILFLSATSLVVSSF